MQKNRPMQRSTALLAAALFGIAAALPAAADTPTKDAPLGAYFRYTDDGVNVRIDKIERVMHVDGAPLAKDADPGDGTTGYLVFTMSIQDAAANEQSVPSFNAVVLFDDQSQVADGLQGPYVGAGKGDGPGSLQPKQTIKVRYVLFGIPADRTVTKIIFDPNQGSAKRRFTIKPGSIVTIPEVPRPKPAE